MRQMPFEAAVFDLDGTLLDSLPMWRRIDGRVLSSRGLAIPEGYGREITGMSHSESAKYTVERYMPGESWEALMAEWADAAGEEYAERIPLKPGAADYLRMLKRAGIRLAVATALPTRLYEPCLRRLGIYDLFDALICVEDAGGERKDSGRVYLRCAEELNVEPGACAVFEDSISGLRGAKAAGMLAFGVRTPEATLEEARDMETICDGVIADFGDMLRFHDFPPEGRCVIFTARCDGDLRDTYVPDPEDYVLCADGGWKLAYQLGVMPDLIIGDFDSSEAPHFSEIERFPVMKDDTDTMLCLKRGLRQGYTRFVIVGGFGGRMDHSYANLQTLAYAAEQGARGEMCDGITRVLVLKDDSAVLSRTAGGFAVFSMSDVCTGVTIRGSLYDVDRVELRNTFPLGASNDYAEDEVTVSVERGMLLVIQTMREM